MPDLLRTQHDRQFLALPGAHERQDWPRSLERHLIEELDPIEVDTEGALRDLLLLQQEQEVLAQRLFTELVGRTSVVLCQLVDSCDIALLGLGGEAPPLQVFQHTASEGGHGYPPVHVEPDPAYRIYTNRKIREPSAPRKRRRKTEHR